MPPPSVSDSLIVSICWSLLHLNPLVLVEGVHTASFPSSRSRSKLVVAKSDFFMFPVFYPIRSMWHCKSQNLSTRRGTKSMSCTSDWRTVKTPNDVENDVEIPTGGTGLSSVLCAIIVVAHSKKGARRRAGFAKASRAGLACLLYTSPSPRD